jgi:hypothetical protein
MPFGAARDRFTDSQKCSPAAECRWILSWWPRWRWTCSWPPHGYSWMLLTVSPAASRLSVPLSRCVGLARAARQPVRLGMAGVEGYVQPLYSLVQSPTHSVTSALVGLSVVCYHPVISLELLADRLLRTCESKATS